MQFIKNIKYITIVSFILLFSVPSFSQEDAGKDAQANTDSIIIHKEKKKFKLFSFFKKKTVVEDADEIVEEKDNEIINDSTETPKKKFSFLKLFKRKNKNDSISNDSIATDSLNDSKQTKKKIFRFKKGKKDSAGELKKPDKIKMLTWNRMNAEQQDSVFKAWDAYDKEFYKKKYAFTKKEVQVAIKKHRNFWERIIYKRARKKPFKHKKKLITRQNNRYKKTLRYERIKKLETAPNDSISDTHKYKIVNKEYRRGAKIEAIRKNKIALKFDKKEDRLRRKYELSENERFLLNKGRGVRLKGSEKFIFDKARKKQIKFTEKLLELRRKRSFELQSKNVQDRMKKNKKRNKKRDIKRNSQLFKKKKKKKYNKLDSDEYPKQYHK